MMATWCYLFRRWGWMRNSKKVTVKGRNIVDLVFIIVDKSKKNVACELCETAKHLENHVFSIFFHVFFPHVSQVRWAKSGLKQRPSSYKGSILTWPICEMVGRWWAPILLGYYLLKHNGTHGYIILKMDSNPKICGPLSLWVLKMLIPNWILSDCDFVSRCFKYRYWFICHKDLRSYLIPLTVVAKETAWTPSLELPWSRITQYFWTLRNSGSLPLLWWPSQKPNSEPSNSPRPPLPVAHRALLSSPSSEGPA